MKTRRLVLNRELRLGDILYLVDIDKVILRQGDKDFYCFNTCFYSEEEFRHLAKLIAETHKFGIKKTEEIERAAIAYQFVLLTEGDDIEATLEVAEVSA